MQRPRELTYEELHRLLTYHPNTGLFTWNVSWSAAKPGQTAGNTCRIRGCVQIQLLGRNYMAHRLAWFWMTGSWPSKMIDHINRVPSDNRWANLREAENWQNVANSTARQSKIGLPRGVTLTRTGKFSAKLWRRGRYVCLGTYTTAEEARSAYLAAARPHYGEFLVT